MPGILLYSKCFPPLNLQTKLLDNVPVPTRGVLGEDLGVVIGDVDKGV